MDPQNSMFGLAQARAIVSFDVRTYLRDDYFDIVWGVKPRESPEWNPQKLIF